MHENESEVEDSEILEYESEVENGVIRRDGELEEVQIRNEISNMCDQQKNSQVEENLDDNEEENMFGIIEEQGYPTDFLYCDNYGYDDSILNTNLIGLNKSIMNDQNILEINSMVDRLKHDHSEEIRYYLNEINDLNLKIQNLQVRKLCNQIFESLTFF